MPAISLVIVDDHRLFREGLAGLLRSEPGFEVLGEAASARDALRLIDDKHPDVVLLDLGIPGEAGAELIERVVRAHPGTPVLVLTASDHDSDLIATIRAGARGYVQKNSSAESLFAAIRKVWGGQPFVCDLAMERMFEIVRRAPETPRASVPLTPREAQVLESLMDGLSNGEIAGRLVISENTVKTHISHILEKLGRHNRTELLSGPRRG